jgi:hypothetical protein
MIKVSPTIQRKLLNLPESGMGFQIVEASFSDFTKKECIIFNATIAEPTNNRNIASIFKSLASLSENYERLNKSTSFSEEIIDVAIKKDMGIFKSSHLVKLSETKGAIDNLEEYTQKGEYFIRFSHYEDDVRIDKINKRVLPGTYATTYEDAKYCIANTIDPRARYSLPSSLTIEYAFHITPLEKTPIKRGKVEPANEQPGGGDEVFFTKGTDNNTVPKIEKL